MNQKIGDVTYERIDNDTRFYTELKKYRGVWAVGRTIKEYKDNLLETLEG